MSQIHLVLIELDDKIRIIANQMFWYAVISLTEIETVNAFMPTHTKVVPDMILFFTSNIIEQDHGLWAGFIRRDHLFVIRERQEINTLHVIQHAFQ